MTYISLLPSAFKSAVEDEQGKFWGARVMRQSQAYRARYPAPANSPYVLAPVPTPTEVPVYLLLDSEAILPEVRQLAGLALDRASKHLGVDADPVWFRLASPRDVALLRYFSDDDHLPDVFTHATPIWGCASHLEDGVKVNAGVQHHPAQTVATAVHELLHKWQYRHGGDARSEADRVEMERGAWKYEREHMARHWPQFQVPATPGIYR